MTSPTPSPAPDYSVRGLNPDRLAAIEQHAGREVLDVGCGSGAYVLRFADRYRIRGVDYQPFASWQARPELFGISDAARLDLPDGAVDTILCFETLEHLPDPRAALREYHRVARANVILTVPNCELTPGLRASGLIYNHWIDRTHVNFWDLAGITALVRDCGFEIRHGGHINRIDLKPLFLESIGVAQPRPRGPIGKLARWWYKRAQRQPYAMTSLVVGAKV